MNQPSLLEVFESIIFASGVALLLIVLFLFSGNLQLLPIFSWSIIKFISIGFAMTIAAFYYQARHGIVIIQVAAGITFFGLLSVYSLYYLGLFLITAFLVKPISINLLTGFAFSAITLAVFLIVSKASHLLIIKLIGIPISVLLGISVAFYTRPYIVNLRENDIFNIIAFTYFFIAALISLTIILLLDFSRQRVKFQIK